MTDLRASDHDGNPDLLAELLRAAGRREAPSPEAYARTYAIASDALASKLRARRRNLALRLAAGLAVIAIGIAIVGDFSPAPAVTAARLDRLIGAAEMSPSGTDRWMPLGGGSVTLEAGAALRTSAGARVGLLLARGESLRLDERTQITLASPTRIDLVAGTIYLDTGDETAREPHLSIVTPLGITRDIGTQFEVRFRDGGYRLRVRSGTVLLERGADRTRTRAGDEVRFTRHGSFERLHIASDSPEWHWVESVAPDPGIDGETLTSLLDWIAAETGRTIRYDSVAVEDRARITVLHGNVRGLAPLDALAAMLATTDFEHVTLEDGTILIRLKAIRPRQP
jgi:FecR protein